MLIDEQQEGREFWQGEGATWRNSFVFFLARVVSDICAPGFYFTMGISLVLFAQSRLKRNVKLPEIISHFMKRALVLFMMGRFVNICFGLPQLGSLLYGNKVTPKVPSTKTKSFGLKDGHAIFVQLTLGIFEVMTGLSMTMVVAAAFFLPFFEFLNKKNKKMIPFVAWGFFFLFIAISNQVIVHYQYDDIANVTGKVPNEFPSGMVAPNSVLQFMVRLLVIPGILTEGSLLAYPLIPWLSLTILGMGYGYSDFKRLQTTSYRAFANLGVLFLTLFVFLRVFGGKFGNLRGWPRGDGKGKVNIVIEFFYTNKYPPSFAYILLTMGINFLLIGFFASAWFNKFEKVRRVLLLFGKVPLFYYGLHLFTIGSLCAVFSLVSGSYGKGKVLKLENVGYNFPFLALVLLLLYPVCKMYYEFKKSTNPNSLWRLL